MASPSQQELQGISTAQLVQQAELTEEQQQQVRHQNHVRKQTQSVTVF